MLPQSISKLMMVKINFSHWEKIISMAILLIGEVWKDIRISKMEIWPFLIPFHAFLIRTIAIEIQSFFPVNELSHW